MEAYLYGGGIGVIGLLGGIVVGLWFKSKYERARGLVKELRLMQKHEEEAHGRTLEAALADAEKYERAMDDAEEIASRYKSRLEKLRDREIKSASIDDLLDMANDQPRVRVLDSEEAKEAEASDDHQDGDGS